MVTLEGGAATEDWSYTPVATRKGLEPVLLRPVPLFAKSDPLAPPGH
jgi:hypothetical protein